MRQSRTMWTAALLFGFVVVGPAGAENISGTITTTKFITEDSELVGHVTCAMTTEPCIDLAASHITLRLNGFTITGSADPEAGVCNPTSGNPPADGIRTMNVTNVRIVGPGMNPRAHWRILPIIGVDNLHGCLRFPTTL